MRDILKRIFCIFASDDISIAYKIIAAVGIVIRIIALGFLCDTLINELGITWGIVTTICALIINWLIEYPLYKFSYLETGIFYSGGMPALGSALYTIFYLINCAGIFIIKWFYANWIYYVCIASYIVLILIVRGIVLLIRGD